MKKDNLLLYTRYFLNLYRRIQSLRYTRKRYSHIFFIFFFLLHFFHYPHEYFHFFFLSLTKAFRLQFGCCFCILYSQHPTHYPSLSKENTRCLLWKNTHILLLGYIVVFLSVFFYNKKKMWECKFVYPSIWQKKISF